VKSYISVLLRHNRAAAIRVMRFGIRRGDIRWRFWNSWIGRHGRQEGVNPRRSHENQGSGQEGGEEPSAKVEVVPAL
jgi:hypothetical protein